jgi:hypothetical protein
MTKYRKKPVVVEAVRWDGTEKCLTEIALPFIAKDGSFAHLPRTNGMISPGVGYMPPDGTLYIPTLEGDMAAKPGDWIIKGVKGELYPCKPDIFHATYEPVEGE